MPLDLDDLGPAAEAFLSERHLASLTTLRPDGTPHVVAVGFTYEPASRVARVITTGTSRKARNLARGGRAVVCQVDGGRWLSLEGRAHVTDEPAQVAQAVRRYARRYRAPAANPRRVAIEIAVDRALGRV